jgi:fructokinase
MYSHLKKIKFTIAIFGEVLADIFPDATVLGGAPYNVARHLRAFEQNPILISRVGNDTLKNKLFEELKKLDIDQSGIQLDSVYPTGQVTVHMENSEHRFDIKPDQAYDHIHARMAHLTTLATQPDLAYFGTLAQRSMDSRLALETFLNGIKCPRFLDINLRAPWYDDHIIRRSLSLAEIVKLNEEELKTVCDMFEPTRSNDKDRALFLIKEFDLKHLFITCGENGSWALSSNGIETKVKGQPLVSELVDTVGAGDAFAAVCILGILNDWSIEDMLTRAGTFAAAVCTIRGAAPETSDFYLPFIESWF